MLSAHLWCCKQSIGGWSVIHGKIVSGKGIFFMRRISVVNAGGLINGILEVALLWSVTLRILRKKTLQHHRCIYAPFQKTTFQRIWPPTGNSLKRALKPTARLKPNVDSFHYYFINTFFFIFRHVEQGDTCVSKPCKPFWRIFSKAKMGIRPNAVPIWQTN